MSSLSRELRHLMPPASNTGAQNTQVSACIDWVGMTVFGIDVDLVGLLLTEDDWTELERGGMGYRACRVWGSVRLYYDGKPDMGVHVEISGEGCRQMERQFERNVAVRNWDAFFRGWRETRVGVVAFTRIDVAMDERVGLIKLSEIRRAIDEGRCVSRWRVGREMRKFALAVGCDSSEDSGGGTSGHTLYFGSAASRVSLRIYDKALEQDVSGHWSRIELQARDERAELLINGMLDSGVGFAAGCIRYYLDFKEEGAGDSNRSRQATVDWWSEFLGDAAKCRLTVAPSEPSFEKVVAWLQHQVAPSFATILECFGGDVEILGAWLLRMAAEGQGRMRSRHRQIVAGYMAAN